MLKIFVAKRSISVRGVCKCIALELKDKINRRYPLAIVVAVGIYLIYFGLFRNHIMAGNYIDAVNVIQRTALPCFVAVAYLSLDVFYDLRRKSWQELICTKRRGMCRIITAKFTMALMPLIIFYIEMLLICYVPTLRKIPVSVYVRENVQASLFLNFIMLPLVAMCMGAFLGVMLRRWQGYLALACFIFVFLGLIEQFSMGLFGVNNGDVNLDALTRMVTLKQPNLNWVIDELYLIPTEPYRYFLYAGWIFVFVILLVWGVGRKRRKYLISLVMAVVCIACFVQVFDVGSFQNFDNNTDNIANDYSTFMGEDPMEKKANFTVAAYDMKITVGKQLEAEVTMTLDQPMESCLFTLYRGYEIVDMQDENGNLLDYDRELDYVTVFSENKISQITVSYCGYSGTFYSNQNAVFLPGYFAWYPQPGHRPVYRIIETDETMTYGYNLDLSAFSEARFHIETRSTPGNVYSNLKNQGDNIRSDETEQVVFDGTAKTCTLIAGPVEEFWQNGVRMIVPELDLLSAAFSGNEFASGENGDCTARLKEALSSYTEYLGLDTEEYLNFSQVFVISGTFRMAMDYNACYMDDYVFIDSLSDMNWMASELILSKMDLPGLKAELLYEVLDYLQGSELKEVLSESEYLSLQLKDAMTYFACLQEMDDRLQNKEIERILEMINLQDERTKRVGKLSGGMHQRLGIAQALLGKSKLLILDEPTAGLDPMERLNFRRVIQQIEKDDPEKIILISSHDTKELDEICENVIFLHRGKLLACGSLETLYEEYQTSSLEEIFFCLTGAKRSVG